ncbi:similar to An02g12310 [Aspergillus niger]|uniref:Similar to An02g12310 n=1 Tax=Aspergillus niger TaxID=5061 RepID=A0A100IUC9_ASPNG|nr:similar to An02g12310 [Aspergillus niger]
MSSNRLTEHNLFIHDQTIINHDSKQTQDNTQKQNQIPSWLTTLISSERMHKLNAQLALNISSNNPANPTNDTDIDIDADIQHITNVLSSLPPHDPIFSRFKLLEDILGTQAHNRQENDDSNPIPLERFLTPGYSDPYYIVGRALEELGIPLGSLESGEVRRNVARENVDAAREAAMGMGANSVCEGRVGRTI